MTVIVLPDHAFGDFTLDDWDEVRDVDPDHHYELADGNFVVVSPPRSTHADVITRLTLWLARNGYGYERIKPGVGVRVGANGRVPDLVLLEDPHTGLVLSYPAEAVLLAVEVVSPSTARTDRDVKPQEYAAAGIEWFWRVEQPDEKDAALVVMHYRHPERRTYAPTMSVTLGQLESMTAVEVGLR